MIEPIWEKMIRKTPTLLDGCKKPGSLLRAGFFLMVAGVKRWRRLRRLRRFPSPGQLALAPPR